MINIKPNSRNNSFEEVEVIFQLLLRSVRWHHARETEGKSCNKICFNKLLIFHSQAKDLEEGWHFLTRAQAF